MASGRELWWRLADCLEYSMLILWRLRDTTIELKHFQVITVKYPFKNWNWSVENTLSSLHLLLNLCFNLWRHRATHRDQPGAENISGSRKDFDTWLCFLLYVEVKNFGMHLKQRRDYLWSMFKAAETRANKWHRFRARIVNVMNENISILSV